MSYLTNITNAFYEHASKLGVICFLVLCIQSPSFANNNVAGKTILAKGQVEGFDSVSQATRKLKRRSQIFSVDSITTGEKSKAQFSMSDGGLITLKENTKILISNYAYRPEQGEASATLEVVSGGLRSISGLIKKSGGDYQVKTPVGSIGIRGTHFAVEVVGDEVLFAVYSGNIDIELTDQRILSLGSSEDFTFASVNSLGEITRMTQAPAQISLGFVSPAGDNGENGTDDEGSNSEPSQQSIAAVSTIAPVQAQPIVNENENPNESDLYTESQWQGIGSTTAELIAERTGTLDYNNVSQFAVNSSVSEVSNFSISMNIDFDNASVPGGTLSFTDSQGEWFAAYSGLINVDQLDLGINFASHGNNKADGIIFAAFSNGLDEIIGGFSLQEINNPSVSADGSFKVNP